jgi:hypothetical protein
MSKSRVYTDRVRRMIGPKSNSNAVKRKRTISPVLLGDERSASGKILFGRNNSGFSF